MHFRRPIVVALVLVGAASAQTPEDGLRSRIKAVQYAALAEQARIQGDVHLDVKSGVVTLLSGHPLLAKIAVESAQAFGSIQGETDLEVTFILSLSIPPRACQHRSLSLEAMRSREPCCGCSDARL